LAHRTRQLGPFFLTTMTAPEFKKTAPNYIVAKRVLLMHRDGIDCPRSPHLTLLRRQTISGIDGATLLGGMVLAHIARQQVA